MKFKYYSVRNLLSFVFLGLFLVSVFFLIKNMLILREEKVSVKEKKDIFIEIRKRVKKPEEEIALLIKKFNNKDIKGVLEIPSLDIYLPFVKGRDNDYYLRRDLHKKYHISGALFLDYRNNLDNDKQLNLYGHSSPNTILPFNKLFDYQNKEFLNKNKEVILKRNNEKLNYEVIYAIVTTSNDEHMSLHFSDKLSRKKHYDALRSLSIHKEVYLDGDDEILVMQTCLQGDETGKKLAIIAKRLV